MQKNNHLNLRKSHNNNKKSLKMKRTNNLIQKMSNHRAGKRKKIKSQTKLQKENEMIQMMNNLKEGKSRHR